MNKIDTILNQLKMFQGAGLLQILYTITNTKTSIISGIIMYILPTILYIFIKYKQEEH